ncbi:MAG TPA: transposase family protein [Gemmataceae bacterium]|nr:transposase family protein [Gemmataceae bacterium]
MAKPPVEKVARRINKDCSIQRFHQLYSCLPFERARPNQLWQTDLFTFMLKRQNRRVYLVAFMDDHIRFIVGYGLHASQSSALVIEVLRASLGAYGMSAANSSVRRSARATRTTVGATLGQDISKEAKRLAAVILEVLAGLRTPAQAAEALGLSLPRYHQLESRGLRGLLEACEPRPRGRQPDPTADVAALRRENERLQRELTRQQSLVRLSQRTVGLPPPAAPTAKKSGKKPRRRMARALTVAARLREEAEQGRDDSELSPSPA